MKYHSISAAYVGQSSEVSWTVTEVDEGADDGDRVRVTENRITLRLTDGQLFLFGDGLGPVTTFVPQEAMSALAEMFRTAPSFEHRAWEIPDNRPNANDHPCADFYPEPEPEDESDARTEQDR